MTDKLAERLNRIEKSADRLKLMTQHLDDPKWLPILKKESWILLKRSWGLWWHLRWSEVKSEKPKT